MRFPVTIGVAFVLGCCAISGFALGEDFRIESKVYSGKQVEPVSQSTTLFRAGIVYDYLVEPKQVAVFDKPRGRFILLDPERRVKTEIDKGEVDKFTRELRDYAGQHGNAQVKTMLDPKFEPQMNDKTGELVLASSSLTYKLDTLKPEAPEAAQQYREFSDWYVRLNAMTSPGAVPPFARLAVNDELAKRGLIAEKVERLGRGVTLRSEHHVAWRLLPRDFDEIAETAQQLATFKQVSFAEYRAK